MVRVGDMLSKKKSVLHKDSSDMAQKMFRAHASRIPGAPPPEKPLLDGWDEAEAAKKAEEDSKWMGVNFKVFSVLMEELIKWTNVEAEQSTIREVNERHAKLAAAFEQIDVDKSGMIDGDELKQLCEILGMPANQAKIVMKHLDGDGDGKVSFNEFANAVDPGGLKMAQETRHVFAIPSKQDMKAAFKLADVDKSGFVDEGEFLELVSLVIAGKVRGMGGEMPFYVRPVQHMQWGDGDFHPDTDWQDLFFDLLFAGGAFCGAGLLGESLINGQDAEGFAWFLVMFMCIALQWVIRTLYMSRFASTSLFHAILLEQIEFLCISLAIWHIPLSDIAIEIPDDDDTSYLTSYGYRRLAASSYGSSADNMATYTPVEQMRANINGCAFGFSFFLGINSLLYIFRWMEIATDPNARAGARALAQFNSKLQALVATVFFIGAGIAASDTSRPENGYSTEISTHCLFVWAVAWFTFVGVMAYWIWDKKSKLETQAKAESVPMCVSYVIVRVGEWTMCMLGETVLSMLGVPLESDTMVYFMFVCSMLIAGNVQFQGYTIHPIHPEHHVLAKGQFTFKGLLYIIWGVIFYASILVTVGASAKVLTKKATYGVVWTGANWCLCGGLAAAFISNNCFAILHHSSSDDHETGGGNQSLVWTLKFASVAILLFLPFGSYKPNIIVFGCYFMVVAQSALVVVANAKAHDEEEKDVNTEKVLSSLMHFGHRVAPAAGPPSTGPLGPSQKMMQK